MSKLSFVHVQRLAASPTRSLRRSGRHIRSRKHLAGRLASFQISRSLVEAELQGFGLVDAC